MGRILFGLCLFAAVFAQSTFIPRLNPLVISPDLVLVLLFLWAAYHSVRESLLWVFLTGITLDIISIDPLGANGLALLVVVPLAYAARQRLFHASLLVPIILVMVATVVHGVVLYALRGVMPTMFIGFQALMHAVLVPVIYGIVRFLHR